MQNETSKNLRTTDSILGKGNFPNPLATPEQKASYEYGLKYAKAIESQWELGGTTDSFFSSRIKEFETNRDYAAGRQDTQIYKQQLTALDNNDDEGSLLNLDWRPVPIIPKYVNIIVNKTLDRNPKPNLEAIDPVSLTEKDKKKAQIRAAMAQRELLMQAQAAGLKVPIDPTTLPEDTDEAKISLENTVKTDGEIAAQLGARMTLVWNGFDEKILRRVVNDFVVCGMGIGMRINDPSYGIVEKWVDPSTFIHSYTEDPTFSDIYYGGHVEQVTVSDIKRLSGDELSDEDYIKIATTFRGRYGNNADKLSQNRNHVINGAVEFGHDEYIVDILHFQFKCTETQYFEEKSNKYGNKGFYYKGTKYKEIKNSVYERKPRQLEIEVTYSGIKVVGTDIMFSYSKDQNMPRNIYDISRTNLRYFPVATSLRQMMPTSTVSKIRGFADMLQITHLKWQAALAKAKGDGIAVDIEGLENVDLGRGGNMNPLDLQDIYEKTNTYYYRSKTIDGQPARGIPITPISANGTVFQNLGLTYNQYLRMIQDTTGVNEAMDGTSPKGEQLVGVREQAISGGNNAIYDITIATKTFYKKVVEDIVKSLQVIPQDSILYKMYENAIGKYNMKTLNGFKNLPMVNFGVDVMFDMDEIQRTYLENNIQVSLAQKEIDIEDAIAIRNADDLDQAEQLLIVRRRTRMKKNQQIAMENIQAQGQSNAQAAQAQAQGEAELEKLRGQVKTEVLSAEHQLKMEELKLEYALKMDLARIEGGTKQQMKDDENQKRDELERKREEAKDKRQEKQAADQSHMIDQRNGTAGRIEKPIDFNNI